MKYDDASWHTEGDYPVGLAEAAAATHSGMFLAWAALTGLGAEELADDFHEELAALHDRAGSPASLYRATDSQLVDDQLSDVGNAFAATYYERSYVADYEATLGQGLPSLYHVADTWENFDRLKLMLDQRYAAFRSP